jgi:hypothetical protein
MTSARSDLHSRITLDPYLAPFAELRCKVAGLGPTDKNQLLTLCRLFLRDLNTRSVEEDRVATVRLLVALLPDSLSQIEDWLREQSLELAHEVHFTLFCFLDEVGATPSLSGLRQQVILLLDDYLATVQLDVAYAAWMAGDLLGDHWPATESLPVLLRLATDAKNPVGRKGAIHGLLHLLERVEGSSAETSRITALLERISKKDEDQEVRRYAAFVVRERKTTGKVRGG